MNGSAGPMELTHRALMYRGSDELVTLTAREIHGALAVGRPVLAALPTAHLSLVRRALEADEAQVQWVDMAEAGRNQGRILPGVLTEFQD